MREVNPAPLPMHPPRLQLLWAKYREAAPTSNRGKHMRFDPGDVADLLCRQLFERVAEGRPSAGWRAGDGRAASPACGAR